MTKENDAMETLKPCPFCGGAAELYDPESYPGLQKVCCRECGIDTPLISDNEAIAAWNRRVSIQQEAGEAPTVQKIEGFIGLIEDSEYIVTTSKMKWPTIPCTVLIHDQQVVSPPLVKEEKK